MDNLAKDESKYVKYIDITKSRPGNWQYVDVDRFECQIREDETKKWVNLRRRERARNKALKRARRDVLMANVVSKIIGGLIIFAGYSATLWTHEAGPIIATALVGAILIFGPETNKDESVKRLYKEYIQDERTDIE